MRRRQHVLRLVWDRPLDADAKRSSIDTPVISDNFSRFLPEGVEAPLSHSHTVGCLTPIKSAKPVCDVSLSSSHRRNRSISSNIGETDKNAIGRTYIGLRHHSAMGRPRKISEESFMTRALQVAAITFGPEEATVSKIAEWAGVTQPSASGWNFGPKIENAVKLALKINACVDFLYTGRGPMLASQPEDEDLAKLLEYWPSMSASAKSELAGIAYARANPEPARTIKRVPKKA